MTRINFKVKFPCGYEYEFEAVGWDLSGSIDGKMPLCPLHKDKCKKEKKNEK
jgi:hypothetical protein